MASIIKIVGGALLFAGAALGINKLFKAGRTGNKTSINIIGVNPPKLKGGSLILGVDVALDNPTSHTLNLKKPYLTALYNGNEVGNSIPSDEIIPIKENDRTIIKGINIQIPFIKLGPLAVSLVTGNIPKMSIDILLRTEADGIPYTDKQHFEL
jgi:ribosomal protein S12